MEFSLEDLFAEPPPKISGRPKKEEGKQCQTSSKDGSGGRNSPLKADSRHAVNALSPAKTISKFQPKQGESKQCNTSCKGGSESHYSPLKGSDKDTVKTHVAEGHVFSPAKTLSKFQPQQQEHQKNLDSDSGSLDDLFEEPPLKASVKVTCLSTNHNGNLDKEENNMPLVERQKGKMALHHEGKLVQSKTEVANASKGTTKMQVGHKFENVAQFNICESKLKQNDNKTKSDASPPTNVISSSSSVSSDKKNLHCSKMNENLKERSQIIIEDQKSSEENVPKKVKQASSYHVPSLEEILGKSLMTANIAKRTSFSTDDEPKFLKKPRKERMLHMQHGKVISDPNKNDSTCTKLIKDGSVERPTINEEFKKHFLEKKRPKDMQKVKVTEYDGHVENQFIISKQQIEEDTKGINISKKKAGNYLRKLHTKCRVSRKEIQMLETKTVDDESDFFGEVVERPEIAKSQQNTEITEYPYISFKKDIFAEGQVIVKSAAQKRKERKNKKRKAKKKRNKLKGGNIDANSQNNDDDDDDDMILLPRKDTKPHKWPVRTKSVEQQNLQLETELGLKKETSPKNDQSQRELMNENMTNRKEIVIKKKLESAPAPSLLDEIISQSAMLYPSCPKQSLQQSKIKTQTKVDLTNNSYAQPKTLLTRDSAGLSKIKLDENLKAMKDFNKIEMNEWWREGNLEESKKVLDKQEFAGNMQKNVKQHSLVVDSCKQLSGSHHTSEKAAKVAAEGKHQENVTFDEKIDSCVKDSLMKNNSTTGDDINDIPMKEIRNQELEEKSLLNIAIENARKEANKTNSTNAKEESLLSLVKDVPLDLTVIDKEEMKTTSKERSKRGGKKRKRRANKGVQGSSKGQQNKRPKMEIETKPKVKCKYFLDGKCRMGAECGFLHEGVPERRELCRYYVTDCCLAENCIFMHSEFPCKFYHAYSKCSNGDDCKYSHKQLTDETKQLLNQLLARDETRKLEIERPENSEEAEDNTGEPATEELVGEDPVANMPKLYESLI